MLPIVTVVMLITFTLSYFGPIDTVRAVLGEDWEDEQRYAEVKRRSAWTAPSKGVVRTLHPARKLEQPVLVPDRPWEGRRVYIYGSVHYDPGARHFRMPERWWWLYLTSGARAAGACARPARAHGRHRSLRHVRGRHPLEQARSVAPRIRRRARQHAPGRTTFFSSISTVPPSWLRPRPRPLNATRWPVGTGTRRGMATGSRTRLMD